jgi:hypothetical protein
MKWTTEKPTKPGWYWERKFDTVHIKYFDRDLFFGGLYTAWETGEWAGPIPEPEEA